MIFNPLPHLPVRSLAALIATKTGPLYIIGDVVSGEITPPPTMCVQLVSMLVWPVRKIVQGQEVEVGVNLLFIGEQGINEDDRFEVERWAAGTWNGERHEWS